MSMAEGNKSLEDLLKELGEKLDSDDFEMKGQGDTSMSINLGECQMDITTAKSRSDIAESESSLTSLLTSLADKLERDSAAHRETDQQAGPSTSQPKGDSMETLLTDLHRNLQSSDWLQHNTAEKWVTDNPDLAKEFMEAAKGNQS